MIEWQWYNDKMTAIGQENNYFSGADLYAARQNGSSQWNDPYPDLAGLEILKKLKY
jgi:hypothetical protein